MRLKNNTRHRKKSIQGLRSFKDSLPKNIRETIFKKAEIYSKIVDNWKIIVGKDLSDACYPKSFKNSKESSIKSLNLMVKRGHEVDVEYSRNFLIDRINNFLGYEFINKIGSFCIKRLAELIGLILITISITLLISILRYSPEDPNLIFH